MLTVGAVLVLLIHMQPITYLAARAAEGTVSADGLRDVRTQLTVDAAAALVVLMVTTTLSVYKPRGLTQYGRRKRKGRTTAAPGSA